MPPSEKESGVMLRIPMTTGGRSIVNRRARGSWKDRGFNSRSFAQDDISLAGSPSPCFAAPARPPALAASPAQDDGSPVFFPHDPCPQRVEAFFDPLIAAVDLMDVVDDALPFRAERGEEQGHPGPDVGARYVGALEAAAADDDGPRGVAENDPNSHLNELFGEE